VSLKTEQLLHSVVNMEQLHHSMVKAEKPRHSVKTKQPRYSVVKTGEVSVCTLSSYCHAHTVIASKVV